MKGEVKLIGMDFQKETAELDQLLAGFESEFSADRPRFESRGKYIKALGYLYLLSPLPFFLIVPFLTQTMNQFSIVTLGFLLCGGILLASFSCTYLANFMFIGLLLFIPFPLLVPPETSPFIVSFGMFLLMFFAILGLWSWLAARIRDPQGVELNAEYGENLLGTVSEIQKELDSEPISTIYLTYDFETKVVFSPVMGFPGRHVKFLILGLPMLLTLSSAQIRGILSYELSFLSRRKMLPTRTLSHISRRWLQIKIFCGDDIFFSWYTRDFTTYASVLIKACDVEAHGIMASTVGRDRAASALSAIHLFSLFFRQEFWEKLQRSAYLQKKVLPTFLQEWEKTARNFHSSRVSEILFHKAQKVHIKPTDSFPKLSDRLDLFGKKPSFPPFPQVTAAKELFEENLEGILKMLNENWAGDFEFLWDKWHSEGERWRKKTSEILAKEAQQPLSWYELWEKASLLEQVEGPEKALEQFEAIAGLNPHFPETFSRIGQLQLHLNDPEGLKNLEKAMEMDPFLIPACCKASRDYYLLLEETEKAEIFSRKAIGFAETYERAKAERRLFRMEDLLLPHGFEESSLKIVIEKLSGISSIIKAFLARKQVKFFPEKPLFILGIVLKEPEKDFNQDLLNRLAFLWREQKLCPYEFQIHSWVGEEHALLLEALESTPGLKIIG